MGQNWPRVPLGELLSNSADWITIEPETDYRQITARLWGKGLTLRGVVKGASIAANTQLRVRSGQFLISRIDARHGAFGLVPPELDGAVTSGDFPAFTVDARQLDPHFLQWMSRTPWFVALCRASSEGSTNRVRLKEGRFLDQAVPLPSLPEQRRIRAQLDAAAERVESHRRVAAAIGGELDATLASAFQRITTNVPRVRMGDVAPLVRREITIDPNAIYEEIGARAFGRGLFRKPDRVGSDLTWQKLFRIEAGDLVFSNIKAWEGAFAVAGPEHHGRFGSHRYLTCVPDQDRATANFLWFYLQSREGLDQVQAASPGSADRNRTLGTAALSRIEVPLPPLNAQRWFDAMQERASAARSRTTSAEADLSALLPSLLYRAFDCRLTSRF